MIIKNANVLCSDFIFRKVDIEITGDKITDIGQNLDGSEVIDAAGLMALPGFVDIHTHGCVGFDTCDADFHGYEAMCRFYAGNGVTSFLFTSMTLSKEKLSEIFSKINDFCKKEHAGAVPAGIYFEGPFICKEKKGAQSGEFIIPPQIDVLRELDKISGSKIKVVALAPEIEGALEFIDEAKDTYKISLAHSAADYEIAMAAVEHGASHVTHLYNAMHVPSHRAPGIPGAAFDSGLFTELICDGFHVHPSIVRTTFKVSGDDRVVLVSDSMQAAGMPNGKYALGGQDVFVKDGKATLADGTIAGSSSNLHQCFKNLVSWGIPVESAAKAASINPAKASGLDNLCGSIQKGKFADIQLMNDSFEIKSLFIRGKKFE